MFFIDNTIFSIRRDLYNIPKLDEYKNLKGLYLEENHINEIKDLNNLISLKHISLYNNPIKEIKNLNNLINLNICLFCDPDNFIKEINIFYI